MISIGFSDSDRFDRMKRIEWTDIDRIHGTRCMVVGAGALGNEVIKNLVLAGFRDITLVDMDDIVLSNLSRCLFFRESDIKSGYKAEIVAERGTELDPLCKIRSIVSRIQDVEIGDYDVILGCFDNIEARMHVNAHAYYSKNPYIDGATDGMRGRLQVIMPGGPCFECTLNRTHAKVAEMRFTCTGNGTAFVPKTASDITTTSVIAAMQVREAVKIASGAEDMCVKGVTYYFGESGEVINCELKISEECHNHGE